MGPGEPDGPLLPEQVAGGGSWDQGWGALFPSRGLEWTTETRFKKERDLSRARPDLKCFAAILCLKPTHLTDENEEVWGSM